MSEAPNTVKSPIAVVGVSALFPGSIEAGGFWRDILAGRDLITDVPESHWLVEDYYDPDPKAPDKTYAKRGAFLPEVDFDPVAFGIPPTIAPATDTAQLLGLIVAQQVLDDAAQGQFDALDKSRISVILGVTSAQELLATMISRLQRPVWKKALRESGLPESQVQAICDRIAEQYIPWQESSFPGLLGNVVAGRIANRFDLGGTNCVTDAACASAFASVSMAVNELRLGDSDMVIAGGVDTLNDIFMYMCFSKTPALSPTGDCRPFSDQADGTLLGEGMAMVALKRLADAERDGDRVYAVLKGIGASSDGRAKSVYAPRPEGQALALARAYEQAGYGPSTVELVEAHGTATKAGDAAEFAGLAQVFGNGNGHRQWCALGSVKSQIGHTKAAAGAAGLFKVVMALHHKTLPPTIKVERPNPKLEVEESPFYLNTVARPWIRDDSSHPRRASVSSFGFGGSNFHLTLEEYRGPGKSAPRLRTSPDELVLLSADSPDDLARLSSAAAGEANEPGYLAWLACTSQRDFKPRAPYRLAVVADDEDDLSAKLGQAAAKIREAGDKPISSPVGIYYEPGAADGKVAFLFPGQGSQYVGMGADLAMFLGAARTVWDRTAALSFNGGRALHEVVFPRPVFSDAERAAQAAELTATEWAQPAIGAVSLSQLALLETLGVEAECVGGHSFGETPALHAAGALDAESMLKVARQRGELMCHASEIADKAGAMTAVVSRLEDLRPLLDEWQSDVVVANHNSPRQVVLSGTAEAIADVEKRLGDKGVEARRLPVSTAFHSPQVAGSSVPFLDFLKTVDFKAPRIDVYSNASAAPYTTEPEAVRQRLGEQITQPVLFLEQIEAMYERGVRTFLEVGPGAVLTGLVGKCLGERPHRAINLDRKGRHGLTSLWHALGQLAASGQELDFSALWEPFAAPADPRDAERPKMTLKICGSNYGKLYPPPGGAAVLPKPNPETPPPAVPEPEPVFQPAALPAPQLAAPRPAAPQPATPQPATPQLSPPAPQGAQLAWVQAYQETQRQTVEAFSSYQRAMADTQSAFFQAIEASYAGLGQMMTGQPAVAAVQPVAQAPPPITLAPQPLAPPPVVVAPPPVVAAPPPVVAAPPPVVVAPPPVVTPAPAAAKPSPDLQALMLDVVADKTGYPVEMLNLSMDMEADLGIDSIKRVEILSAMREKAPDLPEVDTAKMAALKTLAQIVEFMQTDSPPTAGAPALVAVAATAGPSTDDLQALMLDVVADKTGYPAEMLNLSMDMEADLGIDSIKRVEILSAMREKAPELPEVDTARMATLKTLAQIVEFMSDAPAGAPAQETEPEALAPAAASPWGDRGGATGALGRFALREVGAPATNLAMPGLATAGRLVVTDESSGVAQALVEALGVYGIAAQAVTDVPADADAVIDLCGLRDVASWEDALAVNRQAFQAAKAIASRFTADGGVFVTVQDTGGDFGLSGQSPERAALGGLAGLAKTAAQEWPRAAVKAIDLERGGRAARELAGALARELLHGGSELEVGLHADGRRTTLRSELATLDGTASPSAVGRDSVIVASGGARGVTAATLVALAEKAAPRFVLLGRTPLAEEPESYRGLAEADLKRSLLADATAAGEKLTPRELGSRVSRILAAREVRSTLDALGRAGSEARYVAADVQDRSALDAALADVRRDWGAITGIVHGAGVLADKAIAEKTSEQFDHVFDTKVAGLRGLLDATAGDPLELICLFSSVTARCGNQGQSDYAMANEVLNKVAAAERRRRGESCLVKSLNWGPWEGGMVTPALKARFEALGVALIPLADGARMLVEEVTASPAEEVEVVLGGEPSRGPLLGEDGMSTVSMDALVSARSHPYLDGHRIQDKPVFPVVLALEWFSRLAEAHRPDLALTAVRDLKVLRGIQLENFDGRGDAFRLASREVSNGSGSELALELRGHDGSLHYKAVVEMSPSAVPAPPAHAPPAALEPWPEPAIYGDVLFHGPQFQVIERLDGISEEGMAADLVGVRAKGWDENWSTDAALLDGGLQLAVLWFKRQLGGASLPMSIGAFHRYSDQPVDGPVRAVLRSQVKDRNHTVADLGFSNGDGVLLAELRDVEIYRRPDETASA